MRMKKKKILHERNKIVNTVGIEDTWMYAANVFRVEIIMILMYGFQVCVIKS